MFGKDVLDHIRPRRYWHELVLGICIVSGFVVLAIAILTGGGRLIEILTRAGQIFIASPLPSSPAAPAQSPSPLSPAIQSAPFMPAMPFELPNQSGTYDGWPAASGSNQASVTDVPLPIARPDLRVIVGKRDRSVDQAADLKRQPKTTPKSIKSEIDARKAAAAELEQDYADANVAITTRVSGLNGTVLNLHYPQFNDVTVQKIMGLNSFTTALAQVGFKKIIFTANQTKMWSFPLQLASPSTIAPEWAAPGDRTSNEQPGPGSND
jgi:hypothetical protein